MDGARDSQLSDVSTAAAAAAAAKKQKERGGDWVRIAEEATSAMAVARKNSSRRQPPSLFSTHNTTHTQTTRFHFFLPLLSVQGGYGLI